MGTRAQIEKAVQALQAESKSGDIGTSVFVEVQFPEACAEPRQAFTFALAHRFRKQADTLMCLVVKDPSSGAEQALGAHAATAGLFTEVIGVGKLRRRVAGGKRGRTTRATMQFAAAFTHILVQAGAQAPLEEALGPGFYKRSARWPVVVPYAVGEEEKLARLVRVVARSAQVALKPGARAATVLVGDTRMAASKLADNVETLVRQCRAGVPQGAGARYSVKTNSSATVPVEGDARSAGSAGSG